MVQQIEGVTIQWIVWHAEGPHNRSFGSVVYLSASTPGERLTVAQESSGHGMAGSETFTLTCKNCSKPGGMTAMTAARPGVD